MTLGELKQAAGIDGIRNISPATAVVEYGNGHCRPATELEQRLWTVLLESGQREEQDA